MPTSTSDPAPIGVLLANLGTPDAPTVPAVRRYLAEFLWDKRVIDYPRILWWPLLHGVILRVRPPKSAHAYAQIWTAEGSPLLVESTRLAGALQDALSPAFSVALGMTYGNPSIARALQTLRDQGAMRIIVLPLYPQYSRTTTAAVFDRVAKEVALWSAPLHMARIEHYHGEPAYLDALAASINDHWTKHGRAHLFFSFHGIPQRYVDNGDPYYDHCVATARGVTERLQLKQDDWTLAFQSRVGRERWLAPYTDQTLLQYAKNGPKEISVVCPAFATDCLETLEEIALRNREDFLTAGGRRFDYIPCLNSSAGHVTLFKQIVARAARQSTAASPR